MKKSSIAFIGLVAAGALAVATTSAVITCSNNGNESAHLSFDGALVEKNLPTFSRLIFTVNDSIPDNTPGFFNDLSYPLTIMQCDDIASPIIAADPEWNEYVTVTSESGAMYINMDFHGLKHVMEKMKEERRNLVFKGGPIIIRVPQGMLTDIVTNESAYTCLRQMDGQTFNVDFGKVLFYDCKFDTLNMTGNYTDLSTAFTNCTIDYINLTSTHTTDITINGSDNEINSLVWHDGHSADERNFASMTFNTTGIKDFEWIPAFKTRNISFTRKGSLSSGVNEAIPDTVKYSPSKLILGDVQK